MLSPGPSSMAAIWDGLTPGVNDGAACAGKISNNNKDALPCNKVWNTFVIIFAIVVYFLFYDAANPLSCICNGHVTLLSLIALA